MSGAEARGTVGALMSSASPAFAPRPPNKYAGSGLDRLHLKRGDGTWFAQVLADVATRFLPVWQARNLVDDPAEPGLAWIDNGRAAELLQGGAQATLLGQQGAELYICLECSHLETPDHAPALAGCGHFVDLRTVGPLLPGPTAALLATARAYAQWHARHRFCGLCGSPTQVEEAGHQRRCTNAACGASHFPRTDPAVIMLIHDGRDRAILGRQTIWPPGMHSVLAGFVEPGESLEEAVAREVKEEVGIDVAEVTYHSSQPWPFPSSIMLGFWARALDPRLQVDPHELETARWISRAEMLASPENESFKLPRRDSIARRLIEDWLAATA
ncbi:MAG TPA: NAD(+) diphosphatase [Kiloniellales bacterium]|nr:NAD(+) diphosphatase [Kiloniellales bacterium]